MGHSTDTQGDLTIPAAALAAWAQTLPEDKRDDPDTALLDLLAAVVTEDAYEPLYTHRDEDTLHIELYGDFASVRLQDVLDTLGRCGATGQVWFPEDDMWGYTLTPDGAQTTDGAQLRPGDEMLLLTIDIPDRDRHRAIYAHAAARRAIDHHLARWSGVDRRSTDLDAALAAIHAAGGVATCEVLPFAS